MDQDTRKQRRYNMYQYLKEARNSLNNVLKSINAMNLHSSSEEEKFIDDAIEDIKQLQTKLNSAPFTTIQ